jgi:arylformamidase
VTPASIIDISVPLGGGAIDYPGDPPFRREAVASLEGGDACALSSLSMSAHAGTHLDAPAHFIKGGRTLDQYPPEAFLVDAWVVAVEDEDVVSPRVLEGVAIRPGEAVLFRTRNSSSGRARSGRFEPGFIELSPEAARACVALGVSLVGLDYVSVEREGDGRYPVHHQLLAHEVLILEGVDLSAVTPGRYRLACPPLLVAGAEAAPARALLWPLQDDDAGDPR